MFMVNVYISFHYLHYYLHYSYFDRSAALPSFAPSAAAAQILLPWATDLSSPAAATASAPFYFTLPL